MAFSAVRSGVSATAPSCAALSGSASAQDQVIVTPKSGFLSGSSFRSGAAFLQGKEVPSQTLPRSAGQGKRSGAIKAVAAPRKTEEVPAAANPASDEAFKVAANIKYHATYTPAYSPLKFDIPQAYWATAQSLRDTLIQRWNDTYSLFQEKDPKQTYYLSMEFLQGRALLNAVGNLDVTGAYGTALTKLGVSLEEVAASEPDAALGNGGLGRLASCFLDSMATLNYPAWGYGLRYKYGLFHQTITEKGQEEGAERWLEKGNPWEIPRHDVSHTVRFFGCVEDGADGKQQWVGGETVEAVAYDVPIPGYKTKNVISLRLWQATAPAPDFDLYAFNQGEHDKAAHAQHKAEEINLVLYPGDGTTEGKLLRLKQQYTLVSASLQDILATFKSRGGRDNGPVDWNLLPEKVAVQMNDTHPTLVIPELIRLLMDVEGLEWDQAWGITKRVAAYTNHTVLPEALEKWPLSLISEMLPRHVSIISRIDDEFIEEYKKANSSLDEETLYAEIASLRILENVEVPGAPKKAEPVKEIKAKANYNVSVAERLIPAAELSQHISTAGMEASGTSNMKFALNGCLIIGTLDGANVEIREEIGEENFFLFGRYAHEIKGLREERAAGKFVPDPRFEEAKAFIRAGTFGDYDYEPLLDSLEGDSGYGRGDYFLVGADFASYLEAQKEVDAAYQDKAGWAKKSILSTAGSGKFSSDRTIRQYADEIWKIKPLPVQ